MSPSNIEILAYEPSPLGPLCLRRRSLLSEPGPVVTEITLNHEFLMSSLHTASERALASGALEMHEGRDLRALVGGLGLGYTAHEILASDRVSHVEVIEFLPQVIDWLRRGLLPLSGELNGDPRFGPVQGDVYESLLRPPGRRFDVILIDVDHSPDENPAAPNDAFYTEAGLMRAREHLEADGVLGVWSASESPPFAAVLGRVFAEARDEPVTFRNRHVGEQQTDWLFFARR